MVFRIVAAALWFFAVAWGWNLLALSTDLPSSLGLAIGVAVAAFVLFGPFPVVGPLVHRSPARPTSDQPLAPGVLPNRI